MRGLLIQTNNHVDLIQDANVVLGPVCPAMAELIDGDTSLI